MIPDYEEFRETFNRLFQLHAEQANFNKEVAHALEAINERLDRIEQRLDQFSRAIQPRAVNTPFARTYDPPEPNQVTDTDVPA